MRRTKAETGKAMISPFGWWARALAAEDQEEVVRQLKRMTPADLIRFDVDFESWQHHGQTEPSSEGWRTWLMMAGRGFGKTRAGAEWITRLATQPKRPVRIALVGATIDEVRKVMIEGESGLMAVGRRLRRNPKWEPSLGRLTWRGGSVAEVFSGENPDGLRGPQHHFAWCDELAKWAKPDETWTNLQMGLRAGVRPRALITTTPRPIPLIKRIREDRRTATSTGRTQDNLSLEESFIEVMAETYGGTRLGRQELEGRLLEDHEGALWTRDGIERCRIGSNPDLKRVVIGVDPPASVGGTCGIVACGLDRGGTGHVLGDHSVGGLAPDGWARAVARAAEIWEADRVIVETNQGGDMVESVLRTIDCGLPVRPVRARYGKGKRAEPVSSLFTRGKAKFAGAFPELEDELCGMSVASAAGAGRGGYRGPGRSPDRADAMVWAMTELMLGKEKGEPRVRAL